MKLFHRSAVQSLLRAFVALAVFGALVFAVPLPDANAGPGDLDIDFSGDGMLIIDTDTLDAGQDAVIEPGNSIVAAGGRPDSVTIRVDEAGSGATNFTPLIGNVSSVARQADGKIVIAGTRSSNKVFVARFNSGGTTLDSTFGSGGVLEITVKITSYDQPRLDAIATDDNGSPSDFNDDSIVVGGKVRNSNFDEFMLIRVENDGTLSSSFNPGSTLEPKLTGIIATNVKSSSDTNDRIYDIAIDSDQKIVSVGDNDNGLGMTRHNTDGSIDTGFGINGQVYRQSGGGNIIDSKIQEAQGVAIQPDGKIVVVGAKSVQHTDGYVCFESGGNYQNCESDDFWIGRFDLNGTALDASFGSSGEVTVDAFTIIPDNSEWSTNGNDDGAQSVALQDDGKIVVGGHSNTAKHTFSNSGNTRNGSTDDDFALLRLNPTGSLDSSFNSKILTTDFGSAQDVANMVGVQSDGKIVAAGSTGSGSTADFAIARYGMTVVVADQFCDGKLVTIDMNTNGGNGTGTAGDDVILGTPGDDNIDGLDGNDTVCGGDGNDQIVGGSGNDRLFGEGGEDVLRGNTDDDYVDGGPDDDRVLGGTGADEMYGRDGDDFMGGFGGDDMIFGGDGDETIFGGFGADVIMGEAGNDNIRGLIGDDTLHGGDGDDKLFGDRGNDKLFGDAGNDLLDGGNAEDELDGGTGDDSLSGGKADDTLDGGPDTDVCVGNKSVAGDIAVNCETEFGIP